MRRVSVLAGFSNSVDLFDPDFAFSCWLNVQFRVSRLHIKDSLGLGLDSFLTDHIFISDFPGVRGMRMKVKAQVFHVIIACIFKMVLVLGTHDRNPLF